MASGFDIVGVISLTTQIIELSIHFGQDWKDVPSDVRKFLAELNALKLTLKETNDSIVRNPDASIALDGQHSALLSQLGTNNGEPIEKAICDQDTKPAGTQEFQVLVSRCGTELRKVHRELDQRSGGSRFGWERLAAAFRAKEMRQCVQDLHRECQQLKMMISIDSIVLQAKTNLKIRELGEAQQRHHDDAMRKLQDWRDEDRDAKLSLQDGIDHIASEQGKVFLEATKRWPVFDGLARDQQGAKRLLLSMLQFAGILSTDRSAVSTEKKRDAVI